MEPDFIIGQDYSRREIHEKVGGSLVSYLPTREGAVVCACLTKKLNPRAPEEILVGTGPGIEGAGEILIGQTSPIPVFIKRSVNRWTYHGLWQVKEIPSSKRPGSIPRWSGSRPPDTVSRVIYLERFDK